MFTREGLENDIGAHSGPVTALAYDRGLGLLASGGEDGRVLAGRGSGWQWELEVGEPVPALTWALGDFLVAKIGGAGGRLLVMRLG